MQLFATFTPMLRKFFILALFFGVVFVSLAQSQKAIVYFTDKPQTAFDPYAYFDSKTLERRQLAGIPLVTPYDLPVSKAYLDKVLRFSDSLKMVSRWLNAGVVYTTVQQLAQIQALPFVEKAYFLTPTLTFSACQKLEDVELNDDELSLLKEQVNRLGMEAFRKEDITGKGVRVAVFDVGFGEVDVHPAFEHIRARNGIVKTYDFVSKKEDVYRSGNHGRQVLSNIAGMMDSLPMGLATDAEFLLARTERRLFEPLSEEENWLAAAEWADKNGAQIINSSLGYTKKRYAEREMDGHTSLVAEAARIATRLGILVVNSAGNEGDGNWKIIGTPADVDSVLSIGGIDPNTDYHIDFSSYGPTADLLRKPNVSAQGNTLTASTNGNYTSSFGTSFSSPLVAGFAACVLQHKPTLTNMELFKEIERSGHLYPYYDYAHGYGIPQASYIMGTNEPVTPTFNLRDNGEELVVQLTDTSHLSEEVKPLSDNYLYFHFSDENGYIFKYTVIKVEERIPISFYKPDIEKYAVLRIHHKGYTLTKDL